MNGNNPNAYTGYDSDRIDSALQYALEHERVLEITPRQGEDGRDFWLIDRAICVPGDFEVRLCDCKIKLSDRCRDNFFRSANCGAGIRDIKPLSNIRIIGIGDNAVLEGADHPRVSGDSSKSLTVDEIKGWHSYGTDVLIDPGTKPDWRELGILFAEVSNFELKNFTMINPHCWAINFEYCSFGKVSQIRFDSCENRLVDGKPARFLNMDGIDLRRGCHDIDIEDISGRTGDDTVALTALRGNNPDIIPAGEYGRTAVSSSASRGRGDDVYNVRIRNIRSHSTGGHNIVRLLNAMGIRIYNVEIDNVYDNSPADHHCQQCVKIGDTNPKWGGGTPLGDTFNIQVRNISSNAKNALTVAGSLADSVIDGVENRNPEGNTYNFSCGREKIRNVKVSSPDFEI